MAEQFDHYRLRVGGLVEAPREFSFSDLKALPKQEQITTYFCIQGWSGVAKWGGVPMRDILDIVKPAPDARYAVFYSFSEGSAGSGYYDVHEIDNMRHRLRNIAQAAFPKLARLRTTNQSPLILAAPAAQPALTSAAPGLCEIAQHHTRLSFICWARLRRRFDEMPSPATLAR